MVPQSSGLSHALFNILINDLDERIEGMVIKFADDTKLDRIVNILEHKNKIQNDFDRLEN